MANNIITALPITEDLRFLEKLIKELKSEFGNNLSHYKLENNLFTHVYFLQQLKSFNNEELLLILTHGVDNSLRGCSYRKAYPEHRKKFVYEEKTGKKFIDRNNISLFANKKIISVACNSNNIGKLSISNGAIVFVGFDNIDFDVIQPYNQYVVAHSKYYFRKAIYYSISYSIKKNLSFNDFLELFKIYTNKYSDNLILNNRQSKGFKYYKRAADSLQEIKYGIRLFGEGNTKILKK